MFILFDFWTEVWGILRKVFLLIDSIGLTFIDDAYDLIIGAATAFDGTEVAKLASEISKNCYIIIGIFALFRIALMLINAIINPDKLTDKQEGYGNMLSRLIITIVLFIAVPIIFDLSRELQSEIINNNYISKILIGKELIGSGASNGNPGQQMKDIAVRTLIYPDSRLAESNSTEFAAVENSPCAGDSACEAAISAWNADVSYNTLNMYIASYVEDGDDMIMVYHYTPFVTLAVGIFITYVLFSFAIDIALRSVELVVLEVLSPLFIVTYIDPKQGSKGTFSKWLSACGKTYLNLFIRIAVICLMLLLISKMNSLFKIATGSKGLLQLLMIIAILIFAKKAPKWLGDILGIDGGSLGGLGIGKKIAGAALVGGAIGKGFDSAKKWGSQKTKNFGANRIRNTAARVGGMHEAHQQNKATKKQLGDSYDRKNDRMSLWNAGRAASKNSRAQNWGSDSQGAIKAATAGFMGGRLNFNPQAQTLNAKLKTNAASKALGFNTKIGNTPELIDKRKDEAKKLKTATQMRQGKVVMDGTERDKIKGWQGYNEFKNAIGSNVLTLEAAYRKDAANNGIAYTPDYKNNFTTAGQKDFEAFVAKNFQTHSDILVSNINKRMANDEKITNFSKEIAQLIATGVPTTDPAIVKLQQQKAQTERENNLIKSQSDAVISNLQNAEQSYLSAPHKCPSAIPDGDDFVTAVGRFNKQPDGSFVYVPDPGASDSTTFILNPTTINEISNKVATSTSSKESDAKEAHSAMEPKSN